MGGACDIIVHHHKDCIEMKQKTDGSIRHTASDHSTSKLSFFVY
jgi:hypothetical protein